MSTLIDIQSQIKRLQEQESELRTQEFEQTRLDIIAKMEAFGMTIKDLQGSLPRESKNTRNSSIDGTKSPSNRKSLGGKKSRAGIPVAAKYRGPNGETWTGRGLMPRWLKALTLEGKTKEDFEIKGAHNPQSEQNNTDDGFAATDNNSDTNNT